MAGPLPTPTNRARTNSPALGVWSVPAAPLCDPPAGLLDETVQQWHEYWSSPVAGGCTIDSLPALIRLFRLRDMAARAHDDYLAEPLITGSQGQQVLNPQGRHAADLEEKIRQLEDRFGLTPQARLRLGVTLADATEAAGRAAAAAKQLPDVEGDTGADPRQSYIDAAAADVRAGGEAVDGDQPRPR